MMKVGHSLGWDLHAHLVPGVDDGVRTLDEAMQAITALRHVGYEGCILTPHIYHDQYPNTKPGLERAFDLLRRELDRHAIDFKLHLAAEYFADSHLIDLADAGELLSFGGPGHRWILLEFPYISAPLAWADPLSAVTRAGYRPVIAHPERYRYFESDMDGWLSRFGAFPVAYQCEIGSLAGQYGRGARRVARELLKRRIPAFWGTDLHRPSQVDSFIRSGLKELRVNGSLNGLLDGMSVRALV